MKTARQSRIRGRLLACVLAGLVLLGTSADAAPLDALARRYRFTPDVIGYILFDPDQGTVVESHLADTARIPASTTKIVVALAALHLLGPEYRFTTALLRDGPVQDGSLHGDLYLRGGGDPSLSSDALRHFVAALKNAGIRRVAGRFLFDDSFLPSTSAINARQPAAAAYNPGVSALSLNYNRVQLQWRHTAGGPDFRTSVWSPADSGKLPVRAIQTGVQAPGLDQRMKFLHSAPQLDRWLLSRSLPPQGWQTLPIRTDPGRVAALVFRTLCDTHGIQLPLPQPGLPPASARPVYTHASPALSQLLADTLRYSSNLSAELIGQVASRHLTGRPLAIRESAAALTVWYRRQLPNTDWQAFDSHNHSGLSSRSRHTPRQLAAILRHGWRPPTDRATRFDFAGLLPDVGRSSPPQPSRVRVRAKSGTMHYADGLAGYVRTRRGRRLGFVILLTDFARRAALDAAFDTRIASTPAPARAWTRRAKRFERALLRSWLERY